MIAFGGEPGDAAIRAHGGGGSCARVRDPEQIDYNALSDIK